MDFFEWTFSRAIMQYLLDKYAKDDSLYPKDLKTRALINARLDFDNGTLWPKLFLVYRPMFAGDKISEEGRQSLKDAVEIVEEFLTRDKWIAGPKMTIADISYNTIFSLMKEFKFDVTPYQKVTNWMKECDKVAVIKKYNDEGITKLRERFAKLGITIKT